MALIGNKNNRDLYNNLLGDLIPDNIQLYVEPFGGEFGLYQIMQIKPKISIYNDINPFLYDLAKEKFKSNLSVKCFNKDYKDILNEYDSKNTFFYCDPPYFLRENLYNNHTFLTKDHHIELSIILKNLKGKFLLSYQDRPLMRKLYDGYNFYTYRGNNFISKPEIAITNYVFS